MELGALFLIAVLLCCFYLLFIRDYLLARRKFKCRRCGKCCRYLVSLSKEEAEKIKKAGYKDFLSRTGFFGVKKYVRHAANGYCMFLVFRDGISYCQLEHIKPKICRNFPVINGLFGKKCDPRCTNFHGQLY
jgi:Fe-S-cluster containining protein